MDKLKSDLFEWCKECAYYKDCYKGGHPHYLEPACGDGPVMSDNSSEQLHYY
jgi:hypothetical protein